MTIRTSSDHLAEALTRAQHHWQLRHQEEGSAGAGPTTPPVFSIAFSRQAGTYGAAIARAVGERLKWPVYDRELVQRIADDMGVRRTLLQSVDEHRVDWMAECIEGFSAGKLVSQASFIRHLVEVLLALAAHGECVIVGRGATAILPRATTLRVRVVAPLDHRISAVQEEHCISREAAAKQVEATDQERDRFVQNHFQRDSANPANYDLILNAARFSVAESVNIVLTAVEQMRCHRMTNVKANRVEAATVA
jgi:cytidylate kinase